MLQNIKFSVKFNAHVQNCH